MLVFPESYSCTDPLNIVFLCGSYYDKKNPRDKRTILKKYINHSFSTLHAIILEENFQFASTNKQYLSYDNIYLASLAQIEQLASLFACKIIIIHETISTAAELGMFAIDPILAQKICLLVPDNVSVEEEKISGFIKLAFFKDEAPQTKVHEIRYYPDVEVHRTSPNKSDYHSFFHDNKIGKFLDEALQAFLVDESSQKTIRFQAPRFQKSAVDSSIVDYIVSSTGRMITINIHIESLKIHLLAMLGIDSIRKELREEKEIRMHVDYIYKTYRSILQNTVETLSGTSTSDYTVSVYLKGSNCSLKQAIGYFLYMLQAANLIHLVQKDHTTPTTRKVQFTTVLDKYEESVHGAIIERETTEFGRLVT